MVAELGIVGNFGEERKKSLLGRLEPTGLQVRVRQLALACGLE